MVEYTIIYTYIGLPHSSYSVVVFCLPNSVCLKLFTFLIISSWEKL